MHVELRDEAREDLVEGALFYALQSPGLEDYFLARIREDLTRLENTAGVHEKHLGFHRSLSEKFPFAIYYLVDGNTVDIVAILDCREDPGRRDEHLGQMGT